MALQKKKLCSIIAICLVLILFPGCTGAPVSPQNNNVTEPSVIPENSEISEEEAMEIAKEFWDWEPYEENGELVSHKSTTIVCDSDKYEGYYTMYLNWWVDNHWSAIDYLYIDKITGEYTQETPQ